VALLVALVALLVALGRNADALSLAPIASLKSGETVDMVIPDYMSHKCALSTG